jgi:hypothetical protein
MQPKMGGKFHLKLNTGTRPIANKYREGKMKSTLKRELKAREAVKMETIKVSSARFSINARLACGRGAKRDVKVRWLSPCRASVVCTRGEGQVNISLAPMGQSAGEGGSAVKKPSVIALVRRHWPD